MVVSTKKTSDTTTGRLVSFAAVLAMGTLGDGSRDVCGLRDYTPTPLQMRITAPAGRSTGKTNVGAVGAAAVTALPVAPPGRRVDATDVATVQYGCHHS